MIKSITLISVVASIGVPILAADPDAEGYVEHMTALVERGGSPRKLKHGESATTRATFKPPVEILIEAKTDSINLRMSYAANFVTFNWGGGRTQLRVEGGPGNGQHKAGKGQIPTNKYVSIRWLVTAKKGCVII